MNILVTNDDGIEAPGLRALYDSLSELGKVTVAAPEGQQSAVSNALNISTPLRVKEINENGSLFGYAITGTPADCVKLAMSSLLDEKPDLLVSGINHGQNTAINILYSGTVAGAMEGMLLGIPSIAVSLASHDYKSDVGPAAEIARRIAKMTPGLNIPLGTMLNVNIPNLPLDEIKGIRVTRQSSIIWKDRYDRRKDPWGRTYYWFAGDFNMEESEEESDDKALLNGFVSVTPLEFKFTNDRYLDTLKNLIEN